ncbi:MAG: hypothetical protein NTZ80_02420 [Patescibacteria group bacterium]|nr:hypothetical protein [Patescibacteria group bacterium]
MMNQISYAETNEFQKDFKKLSKKYRSLANDFELAKVATIELYHIHQINNASIFQIQGFCTDEIQICKIKKFACLALGGRGSSSGIRVIYAIQPKVKKVVFIEIYFKGNQENENRERIKEYLKQF